MLDNLAGYRVILGSKSPRRRELLEQLGLSFECLTIDGIKEEYPKDIPVHEVPEYLSRLKADAYKVLIGERDLVITADTVVISEGKIFGKPRDEQEAVDMLLQLSGRVHEVVSGVTVMTRRRRESFSSVTRVRFDNITPEEACYYVSRYAPLDKAGAYGIQEWIGCVAVEGIEGSFYNVMGLPVNRLYHLLKKF